MTEEEIAMAAAKESGRLHLLVKVVADYIEARARDAVGDEQVGRALMMLADLPVPIEALKAAIMRGAVEILREATDTLAREAGQG